jgi:hypothetical protein
VAEHDPDRLDGASCTVRLDTVAQTLTFEHRGWGATTEQRARSPLVVPLGAIASVEHGRKRFHSWFHVLLNGVSAWDAGPATDPLGLVCSDDPTEFADRVKSAMSSAKPADYEFVHADDLPAPKSSWRRRLAKGTARALVDGFFNTR